MRSLSPGTVIDGRYEIVRQIGVGGWSVVWLARDLRLNGRLWAVKQADDSKGGRGYSGRLLALEEANLLKDLDHPGIVRVADILHDESSVYVVMEYVEGVSLDSLLADAGGPISERSAVQIARQLCDILHYLHSCDPPIIYRDVKPANVILQDDGTVKLVDFGIARRYSPDQATDTVIAGTLAYAAPEQLGRSQTDARSDIYSLGATLYQLLANRLPQDGDFAHLRRDNPQVSIDLEAVVRHATEPDRERRYQDVLELRYDLVANHQLLFARESYWLDGYARRTVAKVLVALGCVVLTLFAYVLLVVVTRILGYEDLALLRARPFDEVLELLGLDWIGQAAVVLGVMAAVGVAFACYLLAARARQAVRLRRRRRGIVVSPSENVPHIDTEVFERPARTVVVDDGPRTTMAPVAHAGHANGVEIE